MKAAVMIAIILLIVISGCTTGSKVMINGNYINVEIANDAESRALGMMYRDYLEPGSGMLFMFNDENERNFWMKNTKIPLDMIFIGKDRRIISIITAEPCHEELCPSYSSGKPAQYVLEVNAGYAEKKKILVGDTVLLSIKEKSGQILQQANNPIL